MGETLKVLIVEDNEADVDLIRERLPETGPVSFKIEPVPRLSEALVRLKGARPDLILLDLGLPDSRGLDTFRAVRQSAPDIPVIVLTGNDDEEIAFAAVKDGAQDYLIKGQVVGSLLVRAARYALERKRAEAALRASETQYRKLFDTCPDGILFADIETKAFTSANPALCRMLGYTEAELKTMGMADIHPKESLPRVAAEFESQARGEKTLAVEIPCLRKDRTVIYADINTASITVDGRTYNEGFFRDVTERKRAEAALSASETRYRRLFESAREGILISDAATGMIVDVNPFLIDLLGYSREQFLGKKVWELGFLKNITANQETVLEFQRQDYVHFEDFPLKTADGRRVDVEFVSNTYIVDRKKVMQCIVRDISERRRSEREVRSIAKFPSESPNPILRIARDGTLLYINEAGMRLLPDWQLYVKRSAPSMLQEVVFSALGSRAVQEVELEHRGNVYLFHVAPVVEDNYANLYGRDITERKRAEEEMRFRDAILSTQQEVSIDGILVVGEDGAIISSNRRFAEMWGIPSDVIESKSDERALQSVTDKLADPEEFMTKVKHLYRAWDETSRDEIALKDGRTFDRYSAPMLGAQGKHYGRVWFFRDITERKQAEEKREKMEVELLQAQKMEAVGRLAGGVAHDFNNNLQVIFGYTGAAIDKIDRAHPAWECIDEIQNAARRSADLTRQLLAFARKQTIAPEVLDLNDAVGGMLKMLGRLIGEDIHLVWRPAHNLGRVKMDRAQVDQVLANLAVNARDAIVGVGKVTIETANVELDEAYCRTHPGCVPGRYVQLAVSDDGCGIDKGVLPNIFEPFFTTKETGKGTGLGLATVYGIAKQNDGFVDVYSELGQGTTFKIYLPRIEAETLAEEAKREAKAPARGTETVLLVEDEKTVLDLCGRLLERLGYTVLSADTPDQAVRLAEEFSGEIHLLITDVIMPQMTGRDLWRRLNALRPKAKCLFMSGYTADVVAHHGILDEGVHFLQKPFSIEALATRTREALDA